MLESVLVFRGTPYYTQLERELDLRCFLGAYIDCVDSCDRRRAAVLYTTSVKTRPHAGENSRPRRTRIAGHVAQMATSK